jgi:hypothetical protein
MIDWLSLDRMAASISSSTTPAARSAAPIERATTASTTSSGTMQLNYFGCLRVTMGLPAGHGGEEQGAHRQHQLDRRADERAALLGVRRSKAALDAVDPLRLERVRRHGHLVHDRSTCRWCARR